MIRSLIAAFSMDNRVIGKGGGLPWHLPDDLARFRRLTMGHTIIHGRRTHESLEGRNLDGRRIIVLSTTLQAVPANAEAVVASLDRAFRMAEESIGESEVFVAGGGRVYREALQRELIDRMYLTLVKASVEGDTYFPPIDRSRWQVTGEEHHPADERHRYGFFFQTMVRREAEGEER